MVLRPVCPVSSPAPWSKNEKIPTLLLLHALTPHNTSARTADVDCFSLVPPYRERRQRPRYLTIVVLLTRIAPFHLESDSGGNVISTFVLDSYSTFRIDHHLRQDCIRPKRQRTRPPTHELQCPKSRPSRRINSRVLLLLVHRSLRAVLRARIPHLRSVEHSNNNLPHVTPPVIRHAAVPSTRIPSHQSSNSPTTRVFPSHA